jgi:hypothetical protein
MKHLCAADAVASTMDATGHKQIQACWTEIEGELISLTSPKRRAKNSTKCHDVTSSLLFFSLATFSLEHFLISPKCHHDGCSTQARDANHTASCYTMLYIYYKTTLPYL